MQLALLSTGARVLHGGDFDRWDLEVRGGMLGAARLLMAVEEHAGGKQLVRARVWARRRPRAVLSVVLFAGLAALAAIDRAWGVAVVFIAVAVVIALRTELECGTSTAVMIRVLERTGAGEA